MLLALPALLLAGCAGLTKGPLSQDASPEAVRSAVAARAKARWDALIRGDYEAAYAFLSPGTRATFPLQRYRATINPDFAYQAAEVAKVQCAEEKCDVTISLTYELKNSKIPVGQVTTPTFETWIIEQGQAWLLLRL
jgi:adenosylcobinamide amidohydrolase